LTSRNVSVIAPAAYRTTPVDAPPGGLFEQTPSDLRLVLHALRRVGKRVEALPDDRAEVGERPFERGRKQSRDVGIACERKPHHAQAGRDHQVLPQVSRPAR
jgi:hypothetical protein